MRRGRDLNQVYPKWVQPQDDLVSMLTGPATWTWVVYRDGDRIRRALLTRGYTEHLIRPDYGDVVRILRARRIPTGPLWFLAGVLVGAAVAVFTAYLTLPPCVSI